MRPAIGSGDSITSVATASCRDPLLSLVFTPDLKAFVPESDGSRREPAGAGGPAPCNYRDRKRLLSDG